MCLLLLTPILTWAAIPPYQAASPQKEHTSIKPQAIASCSAQTTLFTLLKMATSATVEQMHLPLLLTALAPHPVLGMGPSHVVVLTPMKYTEICRLFLPLHPPPLSHPPIQQLQTAMPKPIPKQH